VLASLVVALLLGVAVSPLPARAGATLLAGWEGDGLHQGYGYVAMGQRWPSRPPFAVVARLQASYLYYHFLEDAGTTRVRSPGVTVSAGPSVSGTRGSTALLIGLDLRREERDRTAGQTRTDQSALQLQWEASPTLGPRMRSFALAQYSFANEFTYARASLGRQINNLAWTGPVTTVLGLEAAGQGNRDSDAWQIGAYGDWALTRAGMSLSLHTGYKSSGSPGAARTGSYYAGVGMYQGR
jgi:hypothetical protein